MVHTENQNAVGEGTYVFSSLDSLFCMAISAVFYGSSEAVSETAKRLASKPHTELAKQALPNFINNPNALEKIYETVAAWNPIPGL